MQRHVKLFILVPLSLAGIVSCGKPETPEARKEVAPYEAPVAASADPAKGEPGTSEAVIPPPPPAVTEGKPADAGAQANAADTKTKAAVTLTPLDWKGFENVVAENQGKAIAIDAWASWCVPCREKFPKFVSLSEKYSDQNIVFLGMNFDELEEEESANEFLAETGAKFVNYRMTDELFAVQDRLDFAGVPRYFLYDGNGKIILNSNSIDDLTAKVQGMFAKP